MSKLPIVFSLALLFAGQGQSCVEKIIGPPEELKQAVEAEFRPRFPRAQVEVNPQKKFFSVLTCTSGLGGEVSDELDRQIAARLQSNSSLRQLASPEAALAELFGQRIPYDYFLVGFEDHVLQWNRGDQQVRRWPSFASPLLRDPQLEKYMRDYDQECGLSASPRPIAGHQMTERECAAVDWLLHRVPREPTDLEYRSALGGLLLTGGCIKPPSP